MNISKCFVFLYFKKSFKKFRALTEANSVLCFDILITVKIIFILIAQNSKKLLLYLLTGMYFKILKVAFFYYYIAHAHKYFIFIFTNILIVLSTKCSSEIRNNSFPFFLIFILSAYLIM